MLGSELYCCGRSLSSNSRPSGLGKKSLGQGGGSVASGHANQFSKKLKNPPEGQLCGTLPKCHFTPLKKQAYGKPTWSLPNDTFCRLMRQRLNSHVWKAKLFYWQRQVLLITSLMWSPHWSMMWLVQNTERSLEKETHTDNILKHTVVEMDWLRNNLGLKICSDRRRLRLTNLSQSNSRQKNVQPFTLIF